MESLRWRQQFSGFTVRLSVPATSVMLAVIVTVPALEAVSKPAALIVESWAGTAPLQVTDAVTLEDVPLLYCAVAVNCCVCPTIRESEAGVTAILVTVTGEGELPPPLPLPHAVMIESAPEAAHQTNKVLSLQSFAYVFAKVYIREHPMLPCRRI